MVSGFNFTRGFRIGGGVIWVLPSAAYSVHADATCVLEIQFGVVVLHRSVWGYGIRLRVYGLIRFGGLSNLGLRF